MRLVTYQITGQTRIGALIDGNIVDLNRAYWALTQTRERADASAASDVLVPVDMIALFEGGGRSLAAAREALDFVSARLAGDGLSGLTADGIVCAAEEATLLPPVLRPGKVVCLGLNYKAHAAEGNWDPPDYPVLFHKTAGSLVGHGQAIVIPPVTEQADYEGELAVIIGRRGYRISQEEALSYVAGYCPANDVSARDLQFRTNQWTTGKMLDTFCPLGPALVTRDEVPNPNELGIKTILNGQVMQDANTRDMIFDVPLIVSYISMLVTLQPGDVILTGTPEGVGRARQPPVFLQPGDTVEVSIERLGVLRNPVAAASA